MLKSIILSLSVRLEGRGKWTSTFHTLINTIQPYTQGEENGLQHFTLSLIISNLTLRERKMDFNIGWIVLMRV
jgi:hypothetical protein